MFKESPRSPTVPSFPSCHMSPGTSSMRTSGILPPAKKARRWPGCREIRTPGLHLRVQSNKPALRSTIPMSQHHHHHDHDHHQTAERPKKKLHQDWRFIVAVVLMLIAIATYI